MSVGAKVICNICSLLLFNLPIFPQSLQLGWIPKVFLLNVRNYWQGTYYTANGLPDTKLTGNKLPRYFMHVSSARSEIINSLPSILLNTDYREGLVQQTGAVKCLLSAPRTILSVRVADGWTLGAVENHGKKWQKQTFVKIAKIAAKSRQRHGIKSRARRPLYSL